MIPHINKKYNEFEDVEIKYQYQQLNRVKWYDKILLNRPLKLIVAFLLVAVASPLLIYRFYFFTSLTLPPSDGYSMGSCIIPRDTRIPCGNGSVSKEDCHLQCCYDRNTHFCYHRLPSRFSYIMNQPWTEYIVLQPRIATVPYSNQNSIPKLRLSIDEESATHMIMSFYNSRNVSKVGKRVYQKDYVYEISSPEMNIVVNTTDNTTQRTIFDMNKGPLIASDNIWEIAFKLSNESMYGLGEIPLKRNTSKIIYQNGNDNSVPLIFAKVKNKFHGLLLDMSDPTEVSIHTDNQIIIRSITQSGLKLHLFTGPEPKDIMKDVMSVIGTYKKLEYWMLGVHVCNDIPETNLSTFISDATRERMPYDSHCGNGPIVFNSDQCPGSNVSNIDIVNNGGTLVRGAAKKFVPHVSPFIRYHSEETEEEEEEFEEKEEVNIARNEETANETIESCKIWPTFENEMYRSPTTYKLYKGKVDDYETIYPTYNEEGSDLLMENLWAYNTEVDGVFLENNWPLDVSKKMLNETSQYLPYFNENFEQAFENAPQWNLNLINSSHPYLFDHNKYGENFARTFSKFFNNTNKIWSSSLWMNGRFAVNRQNVNVSWTNLRKELVMAALGGISGSWLWSSPVCGDNENFNVTSQIDLCVKWYMAATYLPMIKIHSKTIPRYPFAYNGTHKTLMMDALNKRLGFLPYFYTVLQEGPLLRPMFYQFPTSEALHDISTQFNVGDHLMIAPNLVPRQSHVHVWLPPGAWYEFWSGLKLKGEEGDPVTMTTTEADFLTFIRGGSVLLFQRDVVTQTAESTRFNRPFSMIIALECTKINETETCEAKGKQYFTSDMTLHFVANETTLVITAEGSDFDPICDFFGGSWMYDIDDFSVYGLADEHNNYDYHRRFTKITDICLLEHDKEIIINLL